MLYIYFTILILTSVVVIYILNEDKIVSEDNIMEDVPNIYVNSEELAKHAIKLSAFYSETKNIKFNRKLIKSLQVSYKNILKGYDFIEKDMDEKTELMPAAEWLLDNIYLVQKEFKDIKHNMPENYYKKLPVVSKGIMKGYPRVYQIAVEIVSHTDGIVDENIIKNFIENYQKNTVLTTGELWALPIMLRVALIQNISAITDKIVFGLKEKKRGDALSSKVINAYGDKKLDEFITVLQESKIAISSHFVERFIKVLRDNAVDSDGIYKWIKDRLDEKQWDMDSIISVEHHKEASYQFSLGNSITSIRNITALNWKDVFEKLSYVEQILREDPAEVYSNMDFESRDFYRHKLEKIAKKIDTGESFVAKKALECARQAVKDGKQDYETHIGYYIIDDGERCLKEKLPYKHSFIEKMSANNSSSKMKIYMTAIILSCVLLESAVLLDGYRSGQNITIWQYIIWAIAILVPISEIVISILNLIINTVSTPRFIPKIEFKKEIPESSRTVVAIPMLISNENRVKEIIGKLEVYYLANMDKNIYFALLGDFKDSDKEYEASDTVITQCVLKEIEKLNKKYSVDSDIFYFLSRKRCYNQKEKLWMGWERKRGKLMEFNSLLRGKEDTSYSIISGDISELKKSVYVITLDADTMLPRDCAKKLIGAMSHILNIPHIDSQNRVVSRGYGIMQPRITVGCSSANKTTFSKIFSGETGIDIYTTAVSDIYQDIFGEGIFTGKGIYDIDTFTAMLENKIPENAVLSHDLLEGSYVRTGLVTDVELVDGYPAYYSSSCKRLHRWVRGDWQLLPWIPEKRGLNTLSRWKIIDNLRRSLLAPSIVILLLLSLTILPLRSLCIFIAFISAVCQIVFHVSEVVITPAKAMNMGGKLTNVKIGGKQILLLFSFIPYQAFLMLDAIGRTLYRIMISKRKMLQWQTAEDVEVNAGKSFEYYIRMMWPGSILALIIEILAFYESINMGIFMLPITLLWFVSPYSAFNVSKDITSKMYSINKEDKNILKRLARENWAYFEDFVNTENNYLGPDNYQEDPPNGVAHRTSPTNIGMAMSSNICAYDMGYIGLYEAVDRIDKTLTTIEKLVKYRGHLYNWYDTLTKEPLHPRYISTVDSGNLVAYMWLAASCLKNYMERPAIDVNRFHGIETTMQLAQREIEQKCSVKDEYKIYIEEISNIKIDFIEMKDFVRKLWGKVAEVEKQYSNISIYWNSKLKSDCSKLISDIQRFAPWSEILKNLGINERDKEELSLVMTSCSINSAVNELEVRVNEFVPENNDEIELAKLMTLSLENLKEHKSKTENVIERLKQFVQNTDFTVLFDNSRELFSIGYDIEKDMINNCYYDMMASEARLASFIAIAKGDIAQSHWFKLSRAMTVIGKNKGLVSWSGTMFEYFMPILVMKNYEDSLLNETYKSVVEGQKRYCGARGVPWGVSEAAFYTFDASRNYQYKAFGIPGIGLKRGLSSELVISPYSTVITLQVALEDAIKNIKRLLVEGMEGKYGFYESIDFTKDRLPKRSSKVIVKCYMIHHQGMSLMALDNAINKNSLVNNFHEIPEVKATELLLQEKVPQNITYDREIEFNVHDTNEEKNTVIVRSYKGAMTEIPETQLMSNGSYSMMISNRGSGYAKIGKTMLYRWREDATSDIGGIYIFIKDIAAGRLWSTSYEPLKNQGDEYETIFSVDKVEYKRKDGDFITYTEIALSSEEDAEIRRVSITNHGNEEKVLEITTYAEVVLTEYTADLVHPAFSNLFINTEYEDNTGAVLANRRPRDKKQKSKWLMQVISLSGETVGNIQYETNRSNFIGRGRSIYNAAVLDSNAPLQNNVGAVIDPIISMRRRIKILPGETFKFVLTTAAGESKEAVIELAKKYKEYYNSSRVFDMAWNQGMVEMKYMNIKSTQINLYQIMASRIIFISDQMRLREKMIKSIKNHQSDLWGYGISGDIPIVTLIIRNENDVDIVKQLVTAHEYWNRKGLSVDLVIINLEETSYSQPLQNRVMEFVARKRVDKEGYGKIHLYNRVSMSDEIINFITAISRLVIDSEKGSILEQINRGNINQVDFIKVKNMDNEVDEKEVVNYIRLSSNKNRINSSQKESRERTETKKMFKWSFKNAFSMEYATDIAEMERETTEDAFNISDLDFYNGYGGFKHDGSSYIILLDKFKNTPAPWINVISNEKFGFHVSEAGSAYTWSQNSRENKITTWTNDPVSDMPGEALYIRDEISGNAWSITSKPIRDNGRYVIEHGFGYSKFIHNVNGIKGTEVMFVPKNQSCKICIVTLENISAVDRTLSATYYSDIVLGVVPQQTAQYVVTNINTDRKYIYAQNPYSEHFGNGKAFLCMIGGKEESFTGSRKDFIGEGQSIFSPEAMRVSKLSGISGAGMEPCMAENVKIELKPNEEKNIIILFGQYESEEQIENCIDKFKNQEICEREFEKVKDYWKQLLGRLQVRTPDKSMDLLLNGWLLYQTISCRYLSRTAFYQSGGAYGFRDQLQDSMAIGFVESDITRKQIIRSAERQFIEGDVQHWWHPIVESGIRTRFSDDLLWLPYVVIDYINNTGDYTVLDEKADYIIEKPLEEGEDERYGVSTERGGIAPIYEHCKKAIERALKFGPHNIPLMGSGDWNDGMNMVGNKGKGESVWLGWFLYIILDKFKEICKTRQDMDAYNRYFEAQNYIKENININAWDGNWYRRAYFDDGTPLGSIQNDECQIDSLSQSFAIISGAGEKDKNRLALEAMEKYLVKEDKGMILLLTPAFNNTEKEPGYIKGYLSGVRENGGQYTHAAIWVIMAEAIAGNKDKAWRYFNMINPINHSETPLECENYKVEPYVMTADVYYKEGLIGRGGWSWYTGAAGWMYRVGIESILGLKFRGKEGFTIEPCIPHNWNEYSINYSKGNCVYDIQVKKGQNKGIIIDDKLAERNIIPYFPEGTHKIIVTI
ncbi:N,N'-diacetylchitobiose phosphorylase [Clostridium oryzae]|uniref:N,N'-diacetylchitobiose phosphorylase n=1 Tax=Clostridium oryzae TaxID=1450648 RepID=A0A1V4IUI8_9CLOT|nr:glucoamylase family protein [Clostridium oryzae]OPJ63563.1 N,N'-diacetylchitobiose phosphorylase [Clostridium oryzae]